jgi:hypothetical protein
MKLLLTLIVSTIVIGGVVLLWQPTTSKTNLLRQTFDDLAANHTRHKKNYHPRLINTKPRLLTE